MRTSMFLGLGVAAALSLSSSAAAQCVGSGSTTTIFAGGNGQAGSMFDIVVGGADMTIDCLDLNLSAAAAGYNIEVYYCNGTSVGNESNAAAWTLITSVSVTGLGPGVATNVDLGGTSPTFAAGQTYGIYVQNSSYPTPGYLQYTNGGPNTYLGSDCDIVTNCGKSLNFGSTFYPREFNGTVHTSAGPAGPALSLTCGGGTATASVSGATPNSAVAFVYGAAGVFVNPGATCNGLALDLIPASAPLIVGSDAAGAASVSKNVAAAVCGSGILVQAADVATCVATNSSAL